MSLVERCWMITSKFSVIAILIITGICFGVFVYPYMKKKREAALVSIVYIGIMSVLYLIPQQIGNFSAYMLGVVAAFLVMYVQDRRNIYQKIFLAVTFFSIRWLAVAMAGRMDDFITKADLWMILSQKLWFLGIRLQEDNGCNMDFMLEREFWILCFVSFSLQLQSV